MSEPQYIRFDPLPQEPSAKTRRWAVMSKSQGVPLAVIRWGRWRRCECYPLPQCEFDSICLRAIADFCDEKTKAHRGAGPQ